ncbi:cysteine protease ATG4B [Dendroctonus ponderosae]|uniref:Cysteine protease n=1 Tax=Dendroctonus ponderosae TaxID=77166 RepID=J3JY33_DENPD|nr:cysteine protease ATG4B [Dendroctonus ponderosae]AEE63118.1 unknown [Dendroctonus ponderosae]
MCNATRDIMDCMFEAVLDSTQDPDDIPQSTEPVWLLGKKYHAINELNTIRQDIVSKLWFTYRKDFVPIGGSDGKTSDKGWGCMLRCGQMVLGQALMSIHLGRDWQWNPTTRDATYLSILKKFEDSRKAPFSIHQIASMGISEGKEVGQWFGPNTVAQVLKKLVKFDEGNDVAIHVALDNVVIISEIRDLCLSKETADVSTPHWKPLLLIVPLRLGLTQMNSIYLGGLKQCFQFKQSLGIIGGKPNSALYFIGYVGNEVIYFDPHTTQKAGSVGNKDTSEEKDVDLSYHCKHASRMSMLGMDPSVAVCFLCRSEADFNDLCQNIKDQLIKTESQPLFEVSFERTEEWLSTVEELNLSGLSDQSDQEEFEIL